ncbi:hypothetical protein GCM10022381_12910 [Leifsonia kafniensis]|uniref:Sulfate permease n=1 Tax=Leifsonia kafniensis TaxID=475957 RepID=A0ABP7KC70_9MICO
MFRLLWAASVYTSSFLRRYMPTNILLDAIRTRRGRKWGIPAMLLAVPYLIAAVTCSAWIAGGGPGWANVLLLLLIWNALKFIIMGPISLVLLGHTRVTERVQRNREPRSEADDVESVAQLHV